MLVLTRKLQQQIKIGEQITVTILRVKGHTVRVGIDAPRDVRVIRGELPRNGEALPGESDAGESTIIEARLVIEGESEAQVERNEPTASPSDQTAGDDQTAPATGPQSLGPHAPAPFRLPQRKRFSRTNSPPLRVAMAGGSPSLAK